MTDPPIMSLLPDVEERCRKFAAELVKQYADPTNASRRASLAFAGLGIEKNVEAQTLAKRAECAFCRWAGVSIEKLDWQTNHPDDDKDVYWRGILVDVKHTVHPRGKLIWPFTKRAIFKDKKFHTMVLVRGRGPFEIAGWTLKSFFFHCKREEAEGGTFAPGTWIFEGPLWPMSILMQERRLWA
jgi:hypothetical protein